MDTNNKTNKKRKWTRMLLYFILLCIVLEVILFAAVAINARRLNNPAKADAIIVLGAQVYPSGNPSPALKRRLDVAADLYKQGYAPAIITTGAQGSNEPMPEADAMKAYLVAQGIDGDAIYCDPNSYNTVQNLKNAKAIMDVKGLSTAIVVTSDYHMWRALSICKQLDIKATSAGSKNAETWQMALRNLVQETASWVKYRITGLDA